MMPHPHTICEFAAMDHAERQAWAQQERLGAQAGRGRHAGAGALRSISWRLGAALVRAGGRIQGVHSDALPAVEAPAAR